MRAAVDYLPFAEVLARQFEVHVIDRRGRGASGPLGPGYGIDKECQDLLAVQAATDARLLFGHSYGALIALETAVGSEAFQRLALYEPGLSVGGCVPTGWMTDYRRRLDQGDPRGAFAGFVRAFGPPWMAKLPTWYLRAVLRVAIRNERWQERFEPLLRANLAEHEQVAALDGTLERYSGIAAKVLLLRGGRSSSVMTGQALDTLCQTLRCAELETLEGLDHLAPDEKAPEPVARRVLAFMSGPGSAAV